MPRRNRRPRPGPTMVSHRPAKNERAWRRRASSAEDGVVRCVSGKAGFPEHVAAAKLVAYQTSAHRHQRIARIYSCPDCGAWHLTSKARRHG